VTISTAQALDRPPRLTQQEGLELLVAGRAIAALHDLPAGGPLDTALGKLARALSPSDAQAVTDLADRIAVRLDTPGSALLPLLGEAIEGRRRVRMAYYVWGRGEMSEREVDPLLVLQQEGHWYLVGADVPSGEQRSFRVDRIREAVLTHATFDHPAWFDAARYADGLPFEPAAGDAVATIEIAPEASWIAEMIPHVAALDAGEGWRRIDVRTASTAWLVRLLLSAGPTARAVAPPELVDAVRAEAARALARYAGA
jgi:proteasome accessory factor C